MARLNRPAVVLCVLFMTDAFPRARAQVTTIGGVTVTNKGLVGVGRVPAAQRDKFGETFGSLSGLALDLRAWQLNAAGVYSGTLYSQPDRGITVSGASTNYRPRRHKFTVTFTPDANGSSKQTQLALSLSETTLLTEANGTPLTGLDASPTTSGARGGFPPLPQAFNGRISLDAEGIALLPDGTFFASDEYGPYLYRFAADGTLLGAIRPPEAFIPKRNGQDSFSANNATAGQPAPVPSTPATGRENNEGLEGLSVSADGRTLYTLMQSATHQDGGSAGQNRFVRLLAYDISNPAAARLTGEWVLPLPTYTQGGAVQVAEQHELLTLSSRQFLVVAHDGNGRGSGTTKSIYRAVLIYDISGATNIAGKVYDNPGSPLAQNGVLASDIVPAISARLIDINDETQLSKFGLNNNSNDNSDTLSDKWESLALAPALDPAAPDDFFLLVGNDNDFSTTSGFQDGASFNAGINIDSMVLVYRVTLPGTNTAPIITAQPSNRTVPAGQPVTFATAASGNPAPAYQWSKDGVAIANATAATLSLASAQAGDSGVYSVLVSNSVGSVTSTGATLAVTITNGPALSAQPVSQVVATGSTVVFSVTATGTPAPTYQWRKDGVTVSGATSATLVIPGATAATAGAYTVVITNSVSSVPSNPATLTVTSTNDPGRLTNLSVLTNLAATVPSFTVGTVISGAGTSDTKPLVVRAAGPSLAPLGVSDFIADPKLELFAGQTVVAANDNWGGDPALAAAMANVGAFPYASATSKDAAIYNATFPARDYTVVVSGVGGATGTAIAEIYDATPAGTFTATSPRLVNVSVLKQISANGSLTLGFTIGGSTAKTVLIRVIGPGLAAVGLTSGTLGDPQLTLFNSSSVPIATNDDWGADPQLIAAGTRVSAFAIGNTPSKDAMLIITLPAGGYTARATGGGNTSGFAIVEVYEVP